MSTPWIDERSKEHMIHKPELIINNGPDSHILLLVVDWCREARETDRFL